MEFTASQIATVVNGTVEGDPNVKISTFAKIEEGTPGALTFLANPKYTHHIYTTNASVVLVRKDFEAEKPVNATLIRVDDPYQTLSMLLSMVEQMSAGDPLTGREEPSFVAEGVDLPADAYIGAFAYVGKGAKLGAGVKIYPQVYVGQGVEIGDGTILYPGVKVYHGCRIGRNCIIHAGAVIGGDGFGFAPDAQGVYHKIPQIGNVVIDDNVEIGANTTVDRATMGSTHVGKGVKLDNLIMVAHNVEIGENTVMASQVGIAGSTKVGANCMLGGQVGVAGHISIGDGSLIGAQSGIPSKVKPGSRLLGSPGVDIGLFARQAACLKRLPDLMNRVADIEKALKKNEK